MEQLNLDDIIVALLFASDEPLSVKKISAVLGDTELSEIRESVERVGRKFGGEGSAIRLEQVAGGFQLSTSSAYSDYVARLYRGRRKQRLSKAAMETLAIIAYRQPVTRADIENLRGVGCGGVIMTLMERSLIRIVGKAKVLGSPFLYGTTQEFLEYLGLNSLKDLPSMEDLEALLEKEAALEPGDDLNGAVAFETEPSEPAGSIGDLETPAVEGIDDGPDNDQSVSTIQSVEDPAPGEDPQDSSTDTIRIDEQEKC
ncbi:MAG: SMC-Scp complex subunit ScpB [Candidatus Latescibacterota bacterium]|nr:MAG: SMC-Scp complex subunit ScpB [Candidatus Latescibacterota bacterium]